jgi:hypothetical protein
MESQAEKDVYKATKKEVPGSNARQMPMWSIWNTTCTYNTEVKYSHSEKTESTTNNEINSKRQ